MTDSMKWFRFNPKAKPPEQKNIIAILDSGIPVYGRTIDGKFCEYDSINDRFVEWLEGHGNGFEGITTWAEIIPPDQPHSELDGRLLLAQARRAIDLATSHEVDLDWLLASIHRHLEGDSLCKSKRDHDLVVKEVDQYLASMGMPLYSEAVRTKEKTRQNWQRSLGELLANAESDPALLDFLRSEFELIAELIGRDSDCSHQAPTP